MFGLSFVFEEGSTSYLRLKKRYIETLNACLAYVRKKND